ncbi:uncharacterized protein PV09_06707 [Verruconis gallopava]|uniref:TauD/TfdA-like domain-containing protein n=1 Tax=Verruconis gallopava TaxID=253628 RepID=A0A0D2A512_9PEZI|nr:uncharacterized protein PV09_06707 [Verruconis gallopava]KIW01858.1 hypothetical protein PV09_06707 [Verruconis gallopava]
MSTTITAATQPSVASVPLAAAKIYTSCVPNLDFVPPPDFKIPESLQQVPINPRGPTEIPLKTQHDYSTQDYKDKAFLPYNTLTSEDPLTPYDHIDVALRADPEKKALFAAIPSKKDMTPNIGTEVRGLQLTSLTSQLKDELAFEQNQSLVRKHPVTGRKALWVNQEYTTKILGMRKAESDMSLNFLFDHIHRGLDFQTRAKWENGTVVVYDNRMVQHSVTLDYPLGNGAKRHLVRVTPQGEVPSL